MHCILWRSMPCSAATTCRIEIPEVAAGINARTGAVASRILVAWCNRDYHRHILFCRCVNHFASFPSRRWGASLLRANAGLTVRPNGASFERGLAHWAQLSLADRLLKHCERPADTIA